MTITPATLDVLALQAGGPLDPENEPAVADGDKLTGLTTLSRILGTLFSRVAPFGDHATACSTEGVPRCPGTVRIFISYRREDSRHVAARLADHLQTRFRLFMDVDTVRPGMDFTAAVREAVVGCDVLLAVIGTAWTHVMDDQGRRRLDDPHDWVVEEIRSALERNIVVIPVLVDGARMPNRSELPTALAALASRQALAIQHESFPADSTRLISAIEDMVSATTGVSEPAQDLYADPDYATALAPYFREQWPSAVKMLEGVLNRHPGHPQVTERLARARQRQQLQELDARAAKAADDMRWRDAVQALEQVVGIDPDYNNVTERLATTRRQLRVAELHADVRALSAAGQWAAVLAADEVVSALDPAASDKDGLATRARAAIVEIEVDGQYRAGLRHLDRGEWRQASLSFVQLLQARPGYRDTDDLLLTARQRLTANQPSEDSLDTDAASDKAPAAESDRRHPSSQHPKTPSRTKQLLLGVAIVVVLAVLVPTVIVPAMHADHPATSRAVTENPATPTPTPTLSGSAAQRLQMHIPAKFRDTCLDITDDQPAKLGITAAVVCTPDVLDIEYAAFYEYSSTTAMQTGYRTLLGNLAPQSDCSSTPGESEYNIGERRGWLTCRNDSDPTFYWTDENLRIRVMAWGEKTTFPQLKKWWQSGDAGPV